MDLYQRAAALVDPIDLRVTQPTKLVINRKLARSFSIEIPAELLLLANKVSG